MYIGEEFFETIYRGTPQISQRALKEPKICLLSILQEEGSTGRINSSLTACVYCFLRKQNSYTEQQISL